MPPERVIANAVAIDSPVPTHSRAASAEPVGDRPDRLGRRVPALRDDVRRAELACDRLAGRIAREGDDPLGAETLRGEDG
jgi:hypothetical protein